ncbi:MAG: hypothetical protein AAFV19_21230 [Pseudomonadota bacterium]
MALALVIFFRLVRTLGPLSTARQAYLRSGMAVLLGILFMDEQFSPTVGVGAALAISSLFLINLHPRRKRTGAP